MRTTSLILFSVLLIFIRAQDCNNPLLNLYGITGLPNPENSDQLQQCNQLKPGQTCCSAQTVSSFQDRLNSLTQRLQNFAATRDLYLAQLKQRYLQVFFSILDDIDIDTPESILNAQNFTEEVRNEIQANIDLVGNISTNLTSINNEFYFALEDYQRARVGCFSTMLNVQASAWCLACDPNYTTKGVSVDGAIAFSENLCQTITRACYPFLEQGVRFNPILRARQSLGRLQDIQANVNNSRSDLTDDEMDQDNDDPVTDLPVGNNTFDPISSQRTVTIPEGCNNDSCPWQCQNIFNGGVLDELLLANGAGPLGGADVSQETTPSEIESLRRILQETNTPPSTWDPDLNASAFQINLVENPGDVIFSDDDDVDDFDDGDSDDNDDNDDAGNDDNDDDGA